MQACDILHGLAMIDLPSELDVYLEYILWNSAESIRTTFNSGAVLIVRFFSMKYDRHTHIQLTNVNSK